MAYLLVSWGQAHVLAQQINVLDQFTSLGGATLDLAEGVLTISNIGSSGQDGAALDVLGASNGQGAVSWSATMFPTSMPVGSVFKHIAEGSRDGNPTIARITATITNTGMEIQPSFSTAALVDIQMRATSGDLIFLGTAAPSDPNDPLSSVFVDLEDTAAICMWNIGLNPPHLNWVVNFPRPFNFTDIHGVPLGQGSALKFTEVSPGGFNIIKAASITGTNSSQLAYSESSVTVVPEPTTIGLLAGLATLAMAALRARHEHLLRSLRDPQPCN